MNFGQLNYPTFKPVWREYQFEKGEIISRVEEPPVFPPLCVGCRGRMISNKRKRIVSDYRCKPCKIIMRRLSGDVEVSAAQEEV